MELDIYQIDAFTNKLFKGNPAAVCVLDEWLEEETMQNIASENNLAETAFVIPQGDNFAIRWFTPTIEVELCGHATLASAHVLFKYYHYEGDTISFETNVRGTLKVSRKDDMLTLDFPVDIIQKGDGLTDAEEALGIKPVEVYYGKTDLMAVYESESDIRQMNPDFILVEKIPVRGIIATAPGDEVDFVSRFFAPQAGVVEDAVTGSAHTTLTPFWSERLGKKTLTARQLSRREGDLICTLDGKRVLISGYARSYLKGKIVVE